MVAADIDADAIESNTFEMDWAPRSGKTARFPEIDRAAKAVSTSQTAWTSKTSMTSWPPSLLS